MKILLYLILFLNIYTNAEKLTLNNPSIVSLHLDNGPISIQNRRYRESALLPNQRGWYSIYLKPGIYDISSNMDPEYDYGTIVSTKPYTLNDRKIRPFWQMMDNVNYTANNDHILHISLLLQQLPFNPETIDPVLIQLHIDSKIIYFDSFETFSIKDNYFMTAGFHSISIYMKSTDTIWCQCPSLKDGFYLGQNRLYWITDYQQIEYNSTSNIQTIEYDNNILTISSQQDTMLIDIDFNDKSLALWI